MSVSKQIPYDGFCLHSVGSFSYANRTTDGIRTEIKNFVSKVGKAVYSWAVPWGTLWGQSLWPLFTSGSNCYVPLIKEGLIKSIEIYHWPAISKYDYTTVTKIKNGQYDAYIRTMASQAKNFSYKFFFRFGHEMNINQGYNNGWSFAKNPADFIAAWRRIYDIWKAVGVTNAIWVWQPNCSDIGGPHHWTEYYPGDSYVDWVGIDLYQYDINSDPAVLMSRLYNDYKYRKPIVVSEWGTNWLGQIYSDASRATFTEKFFNAVEARLKIKRICYWYKTDFKFDSTTPLMTAKYKARITKSRYISGW